ncbi:bifunctional diguanylate cyclase/phosphodiesterase [Allofournierella massiliensis]|uniref:Diguanylate cyclase (GGDEF)-like protein n=2 Tax=Allofournierella massiliensis TaxID=1650663 RepID=A0A4R1R6Y7_9FIRM|nr:EAL domain-containing protein [Fournierella massiliensis]TCL61280.1 diguanylate cyclase (GGDEF)-like protein [Fournierella massiliensis]
MALLKRNKAEKRASRPRMHQRFLQITLSTVLIGISLIVVSCMGIASIQQANRKSYNTQLQTSMNEYWLEMRNRMGTDREALQIMAEYMQGKSSEEFRDFAMDLQDARQDNSFLRMGYYTRTGMQSRVRADGTLEENIPMEALEPEVQQLINYALQGKKSASQVYYDEGMQQQLIMYAAPVQAANGSVTGVVAASKDLSAFQKIFTQPSVSQSKLDVVWVDQSGRIIAASESTPLAPQGTENFLSQAGVDEQVAQSALQQMENNEALHFTIQLEGKEQTVYMQPFGMNGWYLCYADTINSGKSPIYSILITSNVLSGMIILLCLGLLYYVRWAMWGSNKELMKLAYYDRLTGTYNFEKFTQCAEDLLAEDSNYALITMNIRQFQYINEILGKAQADQVLKKLAALLRQMIGEKECFCRSNADQFYLLLHSSQEEQVRARVEAIMEQAGTIAQELNVSYPVILYAGAAMVQESAPPEELVRDLLHKAEFAQKHAVKKYQNVLAFYDRAMHRKENFQNSIESSMQSALAKQEFQLFLQPKVRLENGQVEGAEALVRWIRPDETLVYPNEFIPAFEKNGFCARLDLYMVDRTCRQLREWMDAGYEPICISVNQSRLLFYQSDYVERLCAVMDRYHIPHGYIQLEILEGLAIENIEQMNKTLAQLHEKGFRLSLDDFGSGYSSLNVLAGIQVDEVKFDKDFLLESAPDKKEKNKLALKNVVKLAKDLQITTVAEGVEVQQDEEFVHSIGCEYGQGFFYSCPIPPEEFAQRYLKKASDRSQKSE